MTITHRQIQSNGVELHLAEQGSGAPVVFVHGFPELWYSWRHQLPALAEAGYRAISLDMRGYGESSAPSDLNAYDVMSLCGDLVGLLDELDADQAVFVGHDWGAAIVWELARVHPERVSAVIGMSVPFVARAHTPPLQRMRERFGEDFYIVWFQQPALADRALARDLKRTLNPTVLWGPQWDEERDTPPLPSWMRTEDMRVYIDAFARTGFTGPLNYYRNIDRNWELTESLGDRRIEQPALFLTGERDPVRLFMPDIEMDGWVSDLRGKVVIDGAGHWLQQERPMEVNAAILGFLKEIWV